MLLKTKNFGEIEVKEGNIILFDEGLPGFEDMKRFTIVVNPDKESPFCWLQAIDNPELTFVIIDPNFFKKDYTVNIDDMIIKNLEIEKAEDVAIYSIVVVPEDIKKISANLKAPVLINTKNMKGKQVILDTNDYHVRHYILEELQKQEG